MPSASRIHQVSDGRRAWADITREDTYTQVGAAVALTAHAGAVAALATGAPGQTAAEATFVHNHLRIEFQSEA